MTGFPAPIVKKAGKGGEIQGDLLRFESPASFILLWIPKYVCSIECVTNRSFLYSQQTSSVSGYFCLWSASFTYNCGPYLH